MKKTGWKQLALGVAGALVCRISVMGCYPVIPAYFAAVYLEEQGRWLLSIGMLTGLIAFLPITVIAKYAMAILVAAVTIRLSEWVDKCGPAEDRPRFKRHRSHLRQDSTSCRCVLASLLGRDFGLFGSA